MVDLIRLPMQWRKKGMVTFTRHEISQLMSVYGEKVSKGEWRDYALDCLPDMAVFSIFKHSHENPIYSVTKTASKQAKRRIKFAVYDAEKLLIQNQSLLEVMQVFKEDHKKKK